MLPVHKHLPPKTPYWIARLKTVLNPLVWGPLGIMALVSLFVWELSVHPEWLNVEGEDSSVAGLENNNQTLSKDQRATLAEIDSLPVLVEQLKIPDPAPVLNPPIITFTQSAKKNQDSKPSATNSQNPFSRTPAPQGTLTLPTENLLSLDLSTEAGLLSTIPLPSATPAPLQKQTPSNPGSDVNGQPVPAPSPTPLDPLETAMAEFLTQQDSSPINAESQPTNPSPNPISPQPPSLTPSPASSPSTTPTTLNPYQTNINPYNLPNPTLNPNNLGTSRVPTPASAVPNLANPNLVPLSPGTPNTFSPSQTPTNLATPANTPQFQTIQPQPLNFEVDYSVGNVSGGTTQPTTPAPVRGSIPGRYIGGGEINTFANP